MRNSLARWRWLVIVAVLAMVAAACQDTAEDTTTTTAAAGETTTTAAGETTTTPPTAEGFTYRTGIISDPENDNYWASLDTKNDVYNAYTLGSQPASMFTLALPTYTLAPVIAAVTDPPLGEASGDDWVITVPLKEGMTWSDGEAVTADDVAFTFNTVKALGLGSNWLSAWPLAAEDDPATEDANEFNLGLISVEAADEYTVVLTWNEQPGLSGWQFGAAQAPVLPEHFWASAASGATDAESLYNVSGQGAPSFGPTVFVEREPGAFYRNVANENYSFTGTSYKVYANGAIEVSSPNFGDEVWGGEPGGAVLAEYTDGPYLSDQLLQIYGSQDAAALALTNGDIDFWLNPLGLSRGLQQQFLNADGIEVVANAGLGLFYLSFNTRRFPGSDLAFRQAVDCVIDKEFVAENILAGAVIPMDTVVPTGSAFWSNPDVTSTCAGLDAEQRLNTAVQILEDAGWTWETKPVFSEGRGDITSGVGLTGPGGESVPPITLLAPGPGYDPLRATYSLWAQNFMNDLGIPVTAEPTGFTTIIDNVFGGPTDWDMYILGWSLTTYPDYLSDFFASKYDSTLGGVNNGGYSNPEFDALAEELERAKDLDTARELIFEMQQIIAREAPYVVLFTNVQFDVYRSNLVFPFTEFLDGITDGGGGLPGVVQSF